MQTANDAPIGTVLPDTFLDYTSRALARCEEKLARQKTKADRIYYELCIEGHRRYLAALEAEQETP